MLILVAAIAGYFKLTVSFWLPRPFSGSVHIGRAFVMVKNIYIHVGQKMSEWPFKCAGFALGRCGWPARR